MMNTAVLVLIIILAFAAAGGVILFKEWRWVIGSLAILYIGVFGLIASQWPLYLAIIKLIVGWMVCAILAVTRNPEESFSDLSSLSNRIFKGTAGLILLVSVLYMAPLVNQWLPEITLEQTIGGLGLLLLGVLQLGLSSRPSRVILGLLICLAGFDILYSAVESSLLVAGLLAAINLGLAFIGAYILSFTSAAGGEGTH
jgi:hypothetical protein